MRKIVRKVSIIILIFIVIIILSLILLCKIKEYEYKKTQVPSGLTAVDTVKQYFKYWDDGNKKGQVTLWCGSNNDPNAFDFGEYICKIKLIDYTEVPKEKFDDEPFKENFACTEIITRFTYHHIFGLGDEAFNEEYTVWKFYLVKKTANSDWTISSWGGA